LKEILFFSSNKNKIKEIKKLFKFKSIKILTLEDVGIADEPKEVGETFEENAKIKSDYGFDNTGIPCFADDSGICIESLKWDPGVLSKRFLEKFKTNEECFSYIFKKIRIIKKEKAFFKTSISLTTYMRQNILFNGRVDGTISIKKRGLNGFGYDPIFIPLNFKKTLAEMKLKQKNSISHRSIAVTKLINFLFN
tara:strand:+ start:1170 stop:1751 length:582 start_codon:yes stop_codon:yes gene_type:complete